MRLEIYFNTTKISDRVENFMDDAYDIATFTKDSDFIYVGYEKPINSLYFEAYQAAPVRNQALIEYFNGSWTSVGDFRDDSNGLERPGFMIWNRDLTNQVKNTYEGKSLFWYRISLKTVDAEDLSIKGINLVFSDDRDLQSEYPSINDHKGDLRSFVGFHQAARDEILTDIRNRGKTVKKEDQFYKKIDQFDLMDFEEVRQASKFKALEKLFFWLSDANDDRYGGRMAYYKRKYEDAKQQAFLTLDSNNDGKVDIEEQKEGAYQTLRIIRE